MDDGETRLETLTANEVSKINLSYTSSDHVDEHGNAHKQVGSFEILDGSTHTISDVWFRTEPANTMYDRSLIPEHSAALSNLQDIPGRGRVYDLKDAMALDDAGKLTPPYYGDARTETRTLTQLVVAFNDATEASSRDDLAKKILHRWTGAEGAVVSDYWTGQSSLSYTTPEQLAVTEAFRGEQWVSGQSYRNPTISTAVRINRMYALQLESLRSSLLLQGRFKSASDAIVLKYQGSEVTDDTDLSEAAATDLLLDFSGAVEAMSAQTATERGEFIRSLTALSQATSLLREGISQTAPDWLYEFDYHTAYTYRKTQASNGDPTTNRGTDGTDTFRPSDPSAERLYGGKGGDIYQLVNGAGKDEVHEYSADDGDDVVMVSPDVSKEDVRLYRDSNHLWVAILGEEDDDGSRAINDYLQIRDQYSASGPRIEYVLIDNETQISADELDDVWLSGWESNDSIFGFDDKDDMFDSDAGGNDYLYGRGGDDTYRLGRGTGHDIVHEAYSRGNAAPEGDDGDTILVEAGYTPEAGNVRLRRPDDRSLAVDLLGEPDASGHRAVTDSILINNHYDGGVHAVEHVKFVGSDVVWDTLDFALVALRFPDTWRRIHGRDDMDDIFDSDAGGNDYLYGRGGDDTYRLGRGTGHDIVHEDYSRGDSAPEGDDGDTILVEAGYTPEAGNVRLRRPDDRALAVDLLGEPDASGQRVVTDSILINNHYDGGVHTVEYVKFVGSDVVWDTVDFAQVALRHPDPWRRIHGRDDMDDIFDSDAGGNDYLYGRGGDDTYRLGRGTGHDIVHEEYSRGNAAPEGDDGDTVLVEVGYTPEAGNVRLRRPDDRSLAVDLFGEPDANGHRIVTDSLLINNHYDGGVHTVEYVKFVGSEVVWDTVDFAQVALRYANPWRSIHGRDDMDDIFDSDAGGNDYLYGRGGDDFYRLGANTGHDTIYEGYYRGGAAPGGDDGDAILVEGSHGMADVRIRKAGNDLVVELLGNADVNGNRAATDQLLVYHHFLGGSHSIEKVSFEAVQSSWAGDFHIGTSASESLFGGTGSDVYYLESGFGDDRIVDTGGTDTFTLRGVDKDDVRITKSGSDLTLSVTGTTDRAVFANWGAPGGANKVERIEVGGDFITAAQVDRMISAMATFTQGGGSPSMFDTTSNDYWDPIAAA